MFSIVIPVLNEAPQLPLLLSCLRRDFADSEIVVVDGGSTDGSVAAAMPLADIVLIGDAGRALQMNLGGACAKGQWLCFLHADTRPEFDARALRAALRDDSDWGFCKVKLVGRSASLGVISRCMNIRSRLTRVATGDQCLIVRRSVFNAMGGFASIPLMEDVEICKRLRKSASSAALPLTVRSSGRRWDEQGVVPTVLRMWLLRLAFCLGVPPKKLWAHYYGQRALTPAED